MPDTVEGKINLALINQKQDYIIEKLDNHISQVATCLINYEERIRALELSDAKNKERNSATMRWQAAFTVVLSAVATFLGIKF